MFPFRSPRLSDRPRTFIATMVGMGGFPSLMCVCGVQFSVGRCILAFSSA